MRKRVLQWVAGLAFGGLVVTAYLVLFHTYLFSDLTLQFVNNYFLKKQNIQLQGKLTGGLLRQTFGLRDLRVLVNNQTDTVFSCDTLAVSGWELPWSGQDLILTAVTISNFSLATEHLKDLNVRSKVAANSLALIIDQFNLQQGKLTTDSTHVANIYQLSGSFWRIDGYNGLTIQNSAVSIPIYSPDSIKLSGLVGLNKNGHLLLDGIQLQTGQGSLSVNADLDQATLTAELELQQLPIDELNLPELPSVFHDLKLDMDMNVHYSDARLQLTGPGKIHLNQTAIPFMLSSFTRQGSAIQTTVSLGTELRHLGLNLQIDSLLGFTGSAELFRFDLAALIPEYEQYLRTPIGTINFSGDHSQVRMQARLNAFTSQGLAIDSLYAAVNYSAGGNWELPEALIKQGENILKLAGHGTADSLRVTGSVALGNPQRLLQPILRDRITGGIKSNFQITGALDHIHLVGELHPQDLTYANMFNISGLGKYDLWSTQGQLTGEFGLQGKSGTIFGDSLEAYNLAVSLKPDRAEIEDLHFQGQHNLLSLSGQFAPSGFDVDKLNIILGNDQLKLVDSLHVVRSNDGGYHLPRNVLVFNNGGLALQGQYAPDPGLDLEADFELIDVARIMRFFKIQQDFSGIASGNAHISGPIAAPEIHATLQLLHGRALGYPSDSASVDLTLTQNAVISHAIRAFQAQGRLTLTGTLPWGYAMRGTDSQYASQNFSINFDNYRLRDINLNNIVGLSISGRATGMLSIRGTPVATKLDGRIQLNQAMFDTLNFTQAYSDFIYEDNLLTFDSLSMVTTWGYGSGSGVLPISLDLVAQDRMLAAKRDMGLTFDFNLNKMPFLTSYISTIDAIQGDFIGQLSFSGPLDAPIRNGKVRGHNAFLELSILGNPITDIHAEVSLVDNTLTIDHFSGRMPFSEGTTLQYQGAVGRAAKRISDLFGVNSNRTYAGTISADGQIDLHSFFKPIFNVNIKANEVYYRSTDGQIEAIANGNMKFTGQDTLDVLAVLPVIRAVYFSNFESEESYQETISKTDSSIFRYTLDTQFASDLLISNDQMEAEFEGELWLLDYGDGVMRYSGTLTAHSGGKFYYLGNELTIISGEIAFNSVDFNPQINIEAEIEIDGQPVTLQLKGDLDEPELVIYAEDTQLTQSDVLTYLTINQKLVEVSFDTRSALNPVKTYSEMLVEKQLSKIGRKYTGLDVLDIGINLASDTSAVSRISLGQRLFKNWKVTYESALQPTDGKSDYDLGLEYRINSKLSVTSKINQAGEVELSGRLKFTY